jgi:putative sterol carrier protein
VSYRFPDLQRAVSILVSRGVAHVEEVPFSSVNPNNSDSDLVVTVDASVFEGIAANERNKTTAVLTGEMAVTGKGLSSSLALKSFMNYFEDSTMEFKVPL